MKFIHDLKDEDNNDLSKLTPDIDYLRTSYYNVEPEIIESIGKSFEPFIQWNNNTGAEWNFKYHYNAKIFKKTKRYPFLAITWDNNVKLTIKNLNDKFWNWIESKNKINMQYPEILILIDFPGSFFANITPQYKKNNQKYINGILNKIKLFFENLDLRNPPINYNNQKVFLKLNYKNLQISRLDLCLNIANNIKIDWEKLNYNCNPKLQLRNFKHRKHLGINKKIIHSVYGDIDNSYIKDSWEIHGHTLGTRGSNKIQLRFYSKWLSPNNQSAIKRYGTCQFYRLEYEIGREKLIKYKILDENTNEFVKLKTLNQLSNFKIKQLWKICINNKYPKLEETNKTISERNNLFSSINTSEIYRIKTLLGCLRHYEQFSYIREIVPKIETLFADEYSISPNLLKRKKGFINKNNLIKKEFIYE